MANPDRNTSTPPPNPNTPSREHELHAPTQPEQAAPTIDPRHGQTEPDGPDVSIGKGPGTREAERKG